MNRFNTKKTFLDRHPNARLAGLVGLLALSAAAPYACGVVTEQGFDKDDAKRVVENNGYTNVEVNEVNRYLVGLEGCGKGDSLGFELTAVAENGNIADVVVCKGLFKAATIREN